MNLISVIIPVFNVQEYISKCINSVINQTYTQLEIILVDDGSTDESGVLCDELVKRDVRITVIHQENGGLSDARNTGIKIANGDYVFFLDSDDYLSLDCLETLYNAIIEHDAEVAQTNFYYDFPNYLLYNNNLKGKDKVFTREEAMQGLLEQEVIKNFAWGKLIRADIAKHHLFPKGKYFEDTFWKFYIIHECKKYVAIAKPMLYYLQRSASISGTFSLRNLDQLEGELQRLTFIKNNYSKKYEEQALKLLHHKVTHHQGLLNSLNKDDQQKYRERLAEIVDELKLKERFPNAPNRFRKKLNRLIHGIKRRILVSNDWQRIEK